MRSNKFIKMKLVFSNKKKLYLLDVSSVFYDLELLHDFSLLLFVKEYYNYQFSQGFWYRWGRRLKDEHKLQVIKIIKESPLTLELILNIIFISSGAIWIIIQAIEKISTWKLTREKLKLEVEKLRKEVNLLSYEEERAKIEIENKLREREALKTFEALLRRLKNNPIKIEDIELTLEEFDDEDGE